MSSDISTRREALTDRMATLIANWWMRPDIVPPIVEKSALVSVVHVQREQATQRRERATQCIFFDYRRANYCLSRLQIDSSVQDGFDVPNMMYDFLSYNKQVIGKVCTHCAQALIARGIRELGCNTPQSVEQSILHYPGDPGLPGMSQSTTYLHGQPYIRLVPTNSERKKSSGHPPGEALSQQSRQVAAK